MQNDIERVAQLFKEQTSSLSHNESMRDYEQQREQYDEEYSAFIEYYNRDECYLCGKSFKTISKLKPCLHWLLRQNKFKKKDFVLVTEKYDFYSIAAFLRWVAYAESGVRNINNLKDESSEKKIFEVTIKWKNIEWTLDCSKNDFEGHKGSKSNYPHWHFQMRTGSNQFINFSDYHILFSKDDQLKIVLENDSDSGFLHTFGPGGQGMQEHMDNLAENPEEFIAEALSSSNPEEEVIHMQSIVKGAKGGISGKKINEALDMARNTGKTMGHCFREVLADDENISISTIVSPADSVPKIAKRTGRKKR